MKCETVKRNKTNWRAMTTVALDRDIVEALHRRAKEAGMKLTPYLRALFMSVLASPEG
jgi:hypothetical protein